MLNSFYALLIFHCLGVQVTALRSRTDSLPSTDSTDIPISLFTFTITDISTGKDGSDRLDILHHQPVPNNPLQNRDATTSRPIRDCYEFQDRFLDSQCQHWISPQSVVAHCVPHYDDTVHQYHWYVNCLPNEICVDGLQGQQAYCVSHENFVRLGRNQNTQSTTPSEIEAPFNPTPGTQYAVEAILTGPNSELSVFAAKLEIEAQGSAGTVKGVPRWSALDGGVGQCSDCPSVNISTVPKGTQRIYVNVALQAPTMSGLLYLSHIAS